MKLLVYVFQQNFKGLLFLRAEAIIMMLGCEVEKYDLDKIW